MFTARNALNESRSKLVSLTITLFIWNEFHLKQASYKFMKCKVWKTKLISHLCIIWNWKRDLVTIFLNFWMVSWVIYRFVIQWFLITISNWIPKTIRFWRWIIIIMFYFQDLDAIKFLVEIAQNHFRLWADDAFSQQTIRSEKNKKSKIASKLFCIDINVVNHSSSTQYNNAFNFQCSQLNW